MNDKPRTTADTDAFFQTGEGAQWFNELPEHLKTVWSWELYHGSFDAFTRNTETAQLLETRGGALARFLLQLEAEGLTLGALVAFKRVSRGGEPFNECRNYCLPYGYRWVDRSLAEIEVGGEA